MIPSYEELEKIDGYKTYDLYFPIIGGYFRLTINEEYGGYKRNIAIDYIEGGYLASILYNTKNNYTISRLYKFNKRNYNGLVKLYKEILNKAYIDLGEELKKIA